MRDEELARVAAGAALARAASDRVKTKSYPRAVIREEILNTFGSAALQYNQTMFSGGTFSAGGLRDAGAHYSS